MSCGAIILWLANWCHDKVKRRVATDRNRQFKYYRLTATGKRRLAVEESKWKQLAAAISRVMWPAPEN